MTGNIFSSPVLPQEGAKDPVQPEHMAGNHMNEDAGQSESPRPACGQPLNQDENEPPLTLNLISLEDFVKNNPQSRPPITTEPMSAVQGQSKPTSDHASRFYILCQQRRIVPKIIETEVRPQRFSATVEFGDRTVSIDELFPSKKGAREAVCKLAIEKVLEDTIETSPGAKRKAYSPEMPLSEPEKSENWIGILQEYTQREGISMPEYNESITSTSPMHFTCTVSVPGFPDQFSSATTGGQYGRKQAAKTAAAKQAVLFLRQRGHLPAAGVASPKRRKSSAPGKSGLTQIMQDFHLAQPALTTSKTSPSLPQQLHQLSTLLGLQQPMWNVQCSASISGSETGATMPLWDVAAHFSERDVLRHPELKGAVGQVWRVYGKEKAKLECCEKVLAVLKELGRQEGHGA